MSLKVAVVCVLCYVCKVLTWILLLSDLILFILSLSYKGDIMYCSNVIMYLQHINISITWLANYGCEACMSNICKSLFAAVYNFSSTCSVTHRPGSKSGSSVCLWYAYLPVLQGLILLIQMKLILKCARTFRLWCSKSTQD